ncbi:hypothetical protein BZA77DRAFT_273748 [Pyronema omphalodes]|nr:hypothetical protein BZA77DRAFT_273748 [Pyronema omphalodes]
MAPPPLDRNDLYAKDSWKTRTTASWRLPRRTRRATYACWTLVIATVYFIVTSATSWRVQVPQYFETKPEPLIQIRFPRLYNSLSQVAGNGGIKRWNRNVVYMAANLTAASKLAGLACEMGEYRRTNVHFAFLGFDDIDLDDFRHINGLPQSDDINGCRIYFHDARPERSSELNVERQKVSTKSAFRHILRFIHPQAVFIDPTREADWFLQIARDKARQMDSTLIELPDRFNEDLQWMARLDGGSLNAWSKHTYSILIHADAHAGNLERLLRSIASAWYPTPLQRPTSITIIMSPHAPVHPFTKRFLRSFSWPDGAPMHLTVQHPAPSSSPSASTDLLLSTHYPLHKHQSVLLLSPDAELSPWFAHWLTFTTLNYRYGTYSAFDTVGLAGISLTPPENNPADSVPLLSARPSGNALYFAEHWAEFHSYASLKLHAPASTKSQSKATAITLASASAPWTSHWLEISRARGWQMLYPTFADGLAKVHTEVPSVAGSAGRAKAKESTEGGLMDLKYWLQTLPDSDLPDWRKLPRVDQDGKKTSLEEWEEKTEEWRRGLSRCPERTEEEEMAAQKRREGWGELGGLGDLFCDTEGNGVEF